MNWYRNICVAQQLDLFEDVEHQEDPKPYEFTTRFSKGIPEDLIGLSGEARKCNTFDEFEKDYIVQLKHGLYWHVTDNPNFTIDPELGPRDMSSMAGKPTISKGKLMVTSHLQYWAEGYSESRSYAALIDMSMVPKGAYKQVNRGFGNEFWVDDPKMAKVVAVMPIGKALDYDKKYSKMQPQSQEELRDFYEQALRL